ncbi:hypothetical protein OAC11_08200 [Alphaproteobacteria bacterium]|nr:hypothetical protein [Alphaproteobacteria bacterium]
MIFLLIPVYYLSLTTPFRLIDDYSIWTIETNFFKYLSFSKEGRYLPVFDLLNEISWSLFRTDYSLHHLSRLIIKLITFLLIFRLGQELIPLKSKRHEWISLVFVFAVYFFYPNNPEARLAPQELPGSFFMLLSTYFILTSHLNLKKIIFSLTGFIGFILVKESNIIIGFILLIFVTYRLFYSPRYKYWLIPFFLIFIHTFVTIFLKTMTGGYGQSEITIILVGENLYSLLKFILLPGNSFDLFTFLFLLTAPAFVVLKTFPILKKQITSLNFLTSNKEFVLIILMFLAAVFTFSLSWSSVLRYAYLPTIIFHLIIFLSLRYIFSNYWSDSFFSKIHYFSLIFVFMVYPNFHYQFFLQNIAGKHENRLLSVIESKVNDGSLFLRDRGEYSNKILTYFTSYREFFFPERSVLNISYEKPREESKDYDFILTRKDIFVQRNLSEFGQHNITVIAPTADLLPAYHSWLLKMNTWIHIRNWIGKGPKYLWRDSGSQYPFKWYLIKNRPE